MALLQKHAIARCNRVGKVRKKTGLDMVAVCVSVSVWVGLEV